jgi:hypothetical protein
MLYLLFHVLGPAHKTDILDTQHGHDQGRTPYRTSKHVDQGFSIKRFACRVSVKVKKNISFPATPETISNLEPAYSLSLVSPVSKCGEAQISVLNKVLCFIPRLNASRAWMRPPPRPHRRRPQPSVWKGPPTKPECWHPSVERGRE